MPVLHGALTGPGHSTMTLFEALVEPAVTGLQSRVNDDPFVTNKVVDAEIIEITPERTDERLAFLINT